MKYIPLGRNRAKFAGSPVNVKNFEIIRLEFRMGIYSLTV
jgi:hypothetical protein